jgi:hypothetical protein
VIFHSNTGYNNQPDFNLLGMDRSGADIHVGILRNNLAFGGTLLSNDSGTDNTFNSWTVSGVTLSAADFQSVATTGVDGPRAADGSLPKVSFMHLVTGSDLIDKGTDVGLPFSGVAPDLGAFEVGLSAAGGTPSGGSGGGGRGGAGGGGRSGSGGSAGAPGTGGRPNAGGGGGEAPSNGSGGALGTGGAGSGGIVGTGGQTATGGATGSGAAPGAGTGGSPATGSGGAKPGETTPGGGCACAVNDAGATATGLSACAFTGLFAALRRRRLRRR